MQLGRFADRIRGRFDLPQKTESSKRLIIFSKFKARLLMYKQEQARNF